MEENLWWIGFIANTIIAVSYFSISGLILTGLARRQQLISNPLGLATGMIFLSCGLGHGVHGLHLILPSFGVDAMLGGAARTHFAAWHIWAFDVITAIVGVTYLSLRGRFPALLRTTSMFEDLLARKQEALTIQDNIVQGLAEAKLALEIGNNEQAQAAIAKTLEHSKDIISNLLEHEADGGLSGSRIERSKPLK